MGGLWLKMLILLYLGKMGAIAAIPRNSNGLSLGWSYRLYLCWISRITGSRRASLQGGSFIISKSKNFGKNTPKTVISGVKGNSFLLAIQDLPGCFFNQGLQATVFCFVRLQYNAASLSFAANSITLLFREEERKILDYVCLPKTTCKKYFLSK